MRNHTKIYLKHFGYDTTDFIACEYCGKPGNDIHHLTARSRGGKDEIENLMCLCRECHHEVHFGTKIKNENLKIVHQVRLSECK